MSARGRLPRRGLCRGMSFSLPVYSGKIVLSSCSQMAYSVSGTIAFSSKDISCSLIAYSPLVHYSTTIIRYEQANISTQPDEYWPCGITLQDIYTLLTYFSQLSVCFLKMMGYL